MAPMPPAWLAVEDEESGAMYFYHERTGRTTWEHPADRCALHPLAQAHSLLSRRAALAAPRRSRRRAHGLFLPRLGPRSSRMIRLLNPLIKPRLG